MNRFCVLIAAILGAAFVSGASVPKGVDENKADEKKADLPGGRVVPAVGPRADETKIDAAKSTALLANKTAVFNMAAVMRDFEQAKYQVWLLNKKKNELSKQLIAYRTEYIKIQTELRDKPDHPKKVDMTQDMADLKRRIEAEDAKIAKQLNDEASAIISQLYDKMKAVVDKTAELNGYHLVFSYPDAVSEEERKSAYIKELKLKPPAAQPFFVAPHADITAIVVKTLNVWYPAVDADGKPVDVSRLPEVPPPTSESPVPPAPTPLRRESKSP